MTSTSGGSGGVVSRGLRLAVSAICVAAAFAGWHLLDRASETPLARAWDEVRAAGSYGFRTDVEQTTTPLPTVTNAGRSATTEELRVEGRADLRANSTEFGLWSSADTGGAADLRFRVVDGVASTSVSGTAWRPVSDAGVLSTSGDFAVYLAAATDVEALPSVAAVDGASAAYSFVLDPDALAAAVAGGASTSLVDAAAFRSLSGTGEVWLDAAGRPLRQSVTLQYPDGDSTVSATIVTEFSDFGQVPATSWSDSFADAMRSTAPWLLVAALVWTAAPFLLLPFGTRRRVGLALAATLFATGAVTVFPVTQRSASAQSPAGSDDAVPAVGPAVTGAQIAASMPVVADPHRSVLDPSVLASVAAAAPDDGTDTDADGLSDVVEARIGTEPADADSDGDGIGDLTEVQGFVLPFPGGPEWFTDPTNEDSNGDRLSDGAEWGPDADARPVDTDGDGMPDVFDDDNDDDGVPDGSDASPMGAIDTVFGEDAPFLLTVDGLTGDGAPTVVDVQIRPTAPDRLVVAPSVRDWPDDTEGQVRDVNQSTDDMRLVPMLEILVPSNSDALPGADDLAPYSITTSPVDAEASAVAAYVPLSLVTDELTGTPVGFSGRMRYESTTAWGSAHQVRLVWAVTVDNDVLTPVCPAPPATQPDGCTADGGYLLDQPQVIHRYYDEWRLTGLTVAEERGADIAVLHQNPSAVADPTEQGAMWMVPEVLSERMLARSPDTPDALLPELRIADLDAAFDRDRRPGQPDTAYGLPNVFDVDTGHYASFDEGVHALTVDAVPALLESVFDPIWTGDTDLRPLVLTAYSTTTRSVVLASGDPHVDVLADGVTVDFSPAGSAAVPIDETAGFEWTQYCSTDTAEPVWSPCDEAEMWEHLDARYGDVLLDPLDPAAAPVGALDDDTVLGEIRAMQLFWGAVSEGVVAPVQRIGGAVVEPLTVFSGIDDADLTFQSTRVRTAGAVAGMVAKKASNVMMMKTITSKVVTLAAGPEGNTFKGLAKLLQEPSLATRLFGQGGFFRTKAGAALGVMLVSAVIGAAVLVAGASGQVQRITVAALSTAANLFFNVYRAVVSLRQVAAAAKGVASLSGIGLTVSGTARRAGILGAVVALGLTWGFAIYSIVSNGAPAGSAQANQAFAGALGATVFIALTTALSLTGVGLLLVGVLAVIDGILTIICEAGEESLRNDETGECFTVSGEIVKAFTQMLYAYEIMIDVDEEAKAAAGRPPLVETAEPVVSLVNPSEGWAVGNSWTVAMDVRTNIAHQSPDSWNWQIFYYPYFFSAGNLRSTTVDYTLTSPRASHVDVEWDTMPDRWTGVVEYDQDGQFNLYKGEYSETVRLDHVELTDAGINRSFDVHLNMGHAFPAYECWSLPAVPICYKRQSDDATSNTFDPFVYDVMPATLDEFLAVDTNGDGVSRLAWDPAFGTIGDADGDGLLAVSAGGLDPDDRLADTDADGLSDRVEMEWRQAGAAVSPSLWDTDNDGLSDAQERRLGTNPGVVDTDNDHLTDAEEVRHMVMANSAGGLGWTGTWAGGWQVTVSGDWSLDGTGIERQVWVSSDPLRADPDGDGVHDDAERQLASMSPTVDANGDALDPRLDVEGEPFHPMVPNVSPVQVELSTDDADGYVARGQQVQVTTSVTTTQALSPSVVNVDADGAAPLWEPAVLDFDDDTFVPGDVRTDTRVFTVPADRAAGALSLAARVRAFLAGAVSTPAAWTTTDETAVVGDRQFGWVDLTGASADAASAYVLSSQSSTMSSEAGDASGGGNVHARRLPGGAPTQLEIDEEGKLPEFAYLSSRDDYAGLRGATDAEVACADDGTCLTVWQQYDNCSTLTLNWLEVNHAGSPELGSGIEPVVSVVREKFDDGWLVDHLWEAGPDNGGINWQLGRRGPNGAGFPLTAAFCGEAWLEVLEDDTELFPPVFSGLSPVADDFDPYSDPYPPDVVYADDIDLAHEAYSGSQRFYDVYCMQTLWSCNDMTLNYTVTPSSGWRIVGAVTAADGTLLEPQFDIGVGRNPDVTSNGSTFAVAWTEDVVETLPSRCVGLVCREVVVTEPFTSTPTTSKVVYHHDGFDLFGGEAKVLWTGTEYTTLSTLFGSSSIGAFDSFTRTLVSDANSLSGRGQFDVAHHVSTDATMLAYETVDGSIAVTTSTDGLMTTAPSTVVLQSSFGSVWTDPQVVANPITGGWLVSATNQSGRYVVSLDGSLRPFEETPRRLVAGDSAASFDAALACPASSALPAVDLGFEELPGATTFSDDSVFGTSISLDPASMPGLAYDGAPGADGSDFAVGFNSAADTLTVPNPTSSDHTVAFWYRAEDAVGQQPFTVRGDDANGFRIRIYPDSGDLTFGSQSWESEPIDATLDDGEWHFVAVAFDDSVAGLRVSVDGVATGFGESPLVSVDATDIRIEGGSARVRLDQFQVFTARLSDERIDAIRRREDSVYCVSASVVAGASADDLATYDWSRMYFTPASTNPGRVTALAELGLVVDVDLPDSGVVPVSVVRDSSTTVIGGTAVDPTSGVQRVEVSIDGGAWLPAFGAEAWSFALPAGLTDGAHTIRSRAVDEVGNVEAEPHETVITVDGTGPTVTLDQLAGGAVSPAIDPATGRRFVALSGDVTDAGSGVVADSVWVQLVRDGYAPDSRGWRRVNVSGGRWSFDFDWSNLTEPTGTYGVRVRASDLAGNTTSPRDPLGSLVVDARAPEGALGETDATLTQLKLGSALSGWSSDADSGVASVSVAFRPIGDVVVDPAPAPTWLPATLGSPTGGRRSWTVSVPAGIEDLTQVDLSITDTAGNTTITESAWRGIVDTVAPRLVYTGTPTGVSTSTGTRVEIRYRCAATDRFLDAAAFVCPGESSVVPVQEFRDDAVFETLFPGAQSLTGMSVVYQRLLLLTAARPSMSACDVFGNCSFLTATPGSSAAVRVATPSAERIEIGGAPTVSATVLTPFDGQFVRVTDSTGIAVDAAAVGGLRRVEVSLNGSSLRTWDFAAEGAPTVMEDSVVVTGAIADADNTVVVSVESWDGASFESDPVVYFHDVTDPVVTLDGGDLSLDDTWGAGTDMYVLSGSLSDAAGIASVQVRVNGGQWVEVSFDDSSWLGAVHLPGVDGSAVEIEVRAVDRAGRVTEIGSQEAVDLVADLPPGYERPSATIAALAAVDGSPGSVAVSVAGVAGTNEVAGFLCSLDGAPATVCADEFTLDGLVAGSHVLEVVAVDSEGITDLTPARRAFTVAAAGPQVTLLAVPSLVTVAAMATFTFSIPVGSTAECSLDGSVYTPCASPWSIDDLELGVHDVAVRARLAGVAGTAAGHRWTVVETVLRADGQVVVATGDDPVGETIVLHGVGGDDLVYRIVDPPLHGELVGEAPNLVYRPFIGHRGIDSFSFVVGDGLRESDPATVSITVRMPGMAIYADESVRIGNDSTIHRGSVAVRQADAASPLVAGFELWFGDRAALVDPSARAVADTVWMGIGARVTEVLANSVLRAAPAASSSTPLKFPYLEVPSVPAVPTATGPAIEVPAGAQRRLDSGTHGTLVVGPGATLVLSGGLYLFSGIVLADSATVVVETPTEVRVAGRVLMARDVYVRPPVVTEGIGDGDFVLTVLGADTPPTWFGSGAAVDIGAGSVVHAYVIAPNGTVRIGDGSTAIGSFIARDVDVGAFVQVSPSSYMRLPTVS